MGFDCNGLRFLLFSKSHGVDFAKIAMIGRQKLDVSLPELRRILSDFKIHLESNILSDLFGDHRFSENFFKVIGSRQIDSFDASEYENSTHIYDFNYAIDESFHQKYSAVIDAGTLEHVFNYPQALKNCMEMVAKGGHFISITPGNNFSGHGFYQFSPELFFSVFTESNGFLKPRVFSVELGSENNWYEVKSPVEIQERVTLRNRLPVYLMVFAQKAEHKPIFSTYPQQSDYKKAWMNQSSFVKDHFTDYVQKIIPSNLKIKLQKLLQVFPGRFNARFYKKLDL